jgi:hypothetical protein
VIFPLEIDIYIPSISVGFEYSGLYWHSQSSNEAVGRDIKFDNYKRNVAEDAGVTLYTIFEDEWNDKPEIVKSRIKAILNSETNKIYARKCEVVELSSKEANSFLKDNHLQGSGRSNARYGLKYKNKLVSVMTFSNSNLSRRLSGWEINRFCSQVNTVVVGGASRLFSRFVTDHDPETVISYADRRWSNGELYQSLKFEFDSITPPNFWYFKPNDLHRIHRFTLRKKPTDNPEWSTYENRLQNGYLRIWDCGSSKWVWKKPTNE